MNPLFYSVQNDCFSKSMLLISISSCSVDEQKSKVLAFNMSVILAKNNFTIKLCCFASVSSDT